MIRGAPSCGRHSTNSPGTKPVDDSVWREFATNLSYCQGDLTDAAAYQKLEQMLNSFGNAPLRKNLLFYLATSPSQFGEVADICTRPGCCSGTARRAGSAWWWKTVRPRSRLCARAQ